MAFCPLDLAEQTPLLFLAMVTDLPTYFSTGAQERGWQPLGFGCNTDWKLRSSCSSLTAASVAALRRIEAMSSLLGAREIKMVAGNYLSEPVLHHRQQGANGLCSLTLMWKTTGQWTIGRPTPKTCEGYEEV